jgi:excisionase family DNA binding protein
MAVGFALAQEMMKGLPSPTPAAATTSPPPLPANPPAASIDILTPAQIAESLGVTEADVLTTLESGELKGKKIGASWRVTRAAFDAYLAE